MASKHDRQYNDYMSEVQSYLKKVQGGRRVPAMDPHAPQFSQQADDERLAKRAGLGNRIGFGPPAPQVAQGQQMPQQQPAAPPPGGQGYSGVLDWLDEKRGQLSKALTGRAAAPSPNPESARVLPFEELPANHHYDRAAAEKNGVSRDPVTQHWDSRFKFDDNSRRFLPSQDGQVFDTKYANLHPQDQLNNLATSDQVRAYRHEPPIPASDISKWMTEKQRNPQLYPMPVTQQLPGQQSSPVWGFHEPTVEAGAGVEQGLKGASDVMSDPRNAWIGLGPLAAVGKAGGLTRRLSRGPDTGGFSPKLSEVKEASPFIDPAHGSMPYDPGNSASWRKGYTDHVQGLNNYVRDFNPENPDHLQYFQQLEGVSPSFANEVVRTAAGRNALKDEVGEAMRPNAGGGMLPPTIKSKYGFNR